MKKLDFGVWGKEEKRGEDVSQEESRQRTKVRIGGVPRMEGVKKGVGGCLWGVFGGFMGKKGRKWAIWFHDFLNCCNFTPYGVRAKEIGSNETLGRCGSFWSKPIRVFARCKRRRGCVCSRKMRKFFPNKGETFSFFFLSLLPRRPNLTPGVRVKQCRKWFRVSGRGGYGLG